MHSKIIDLALKLSNFELTILIREHPFNNESIEYSEPLIFLKKNNKIVLNAFEKMEWSQATGFLLGYKYVDKDWSNILLKRTKINYIVSDISLYSYVIPDHKLSEVFLSLVQQDLQMFQISLTDLNFEVRLNIVPFS